MNYFDFPKNTFASEVSRARLASNGIKSNINLFNEILSTAKRVGFDKSILKDHKTSITMKNLFLNSYVLSSRFEKLLQNQQNIGIFMPNAVGHVVVLLSLFKINKTPAILNFSMGEKTLMDCIQLANIKTILTSKEFINSGGFTEVMHNLSQYAKIIYVEDIKNSLSTADKLLGATAFQLKQPAETKEDKIILFTSGSEAKPKGVILKHENLVNNLSQATSQVILKEEDRFFNSLPMFHSFGLTIGTLLPLLYGLNVCLYPNPLHYKEIPEFVFEEQSTFLFGTSTFLEFYSKFAKPYQFHSLTHIVAGGEKVKDEIHNIYFEKFGKRIIEGYGCTELSPVISLNSPLDFKKGTVGKILPTIEYRIEKVEGINKGGNLFLKGPNLMEGYLIHEKGFIPVDEWHDTGDVVDIDENGFVTILSRIKRFSKIGGEMISLNTVEQLATECFNSTSFAAIAVPDKRKGERIILFTTLDESEFKERTFKKFIKTQKVSTLHMPAEIIQISELPLLGSGKIDYVSLKKNFELNHL